MDKSIVRESKYRHLTGKVWKKELAYSNLKANNDAAILRANPTVMIFPTEGSGLSVAAIPLEMKGKQPDVWPQIDCHRSQLTDIDMYPFDDRIFATGSRDSEIKIWSLDLCNWANAPEDKKKIIEDQRLKFKAIKGPSIVLNGHTKKINTLTFHPVAADVLASSSADMTVKIWNIDKAKDILTLSGHKTQIRHTCWDDLGILLASSEKTLKVFDARASTPLVSEFTPHAGAKGFKSVFLGTDKLLTVGFGKGSDRQTALWDLRKLSDTTPPITLQTIDQGPSLLTPIYDPGTGLVYFTGKGDNIFTYEVNNYAPYLHVLEKFNTGGSYFDIVSLPKRICDVSNCEVARFLKLGRAVVDTVSFSVPRKTADRLFQEDIFPPSPKGEPSIPAEGWFKGNNAPPVLMSLQPKGTTSVFDVSQTEGGKSRVVEEQKKKGDELDAEGSSDPSSSGPSGKRASRRKIRVDRPPTMSAGWVFLEKPGWIFSAWDERWLTIVRRGLHFFESDEAANLLLSISFDELSSVESQEPNKFIIKTQQPQTYRFQVDDLTERDLWVSTIEEKRKKFFLRKAANTPKSGKLDSVDLVGASGGVMAGKLEIQIAGVLYSGWYSRWFILKDGLFQYFYDPKMEGEAIETFDLSRVLSVSTTSGLSKDHLYTFKITTANRTIHFSASNEEERKLWAVTLEQYRAQCMPLRAGLPSSVSTPSNPLNPDAIPTLQLDLSLPPVDSSKMEGYIKRKGVGIWAYTGRWTQYWLSTSAKELFYFYYPNDTAAADRLAVALIAEISKGPTDRQFLIKLSGGTEVWYHELESEAERDRWCSVIEALIAQPVNAVDLPTQLKLNIDELLDNPKTPKYLIDPVEVKKGKQPLLIEVKGKRKIRIALTELSYKVLYRCGVFVLDNGQTIYQWNGKKAPRVSKAKALDLTTKLRMKERGGNSTIVVLDDGTTDKENAQFWKLLGGGQDVEREEGVLEEGALKEKVYKIQSPIDVPSNPDENPQDTFFDDDDLPQPQEEPAIKIVFDGYGLPEKEILDTNYAFIVDCFSEIYVWIGKGSKASTRSLALSIAAQFETESQRPEWTAVCKLYEEGETILFKEKFSNYPGMLPIATTRMEVKSNVAATVTQEEPSALAQVMILPPVPLVEKQIDDCSGSVTVWKIEEFDKVLMPESTLGTFWSGDSFLLQYSYKKGDKDCNLIYFWQGRFSSRSEKGTSAYLTVDLSDELDNAEQTRIEEGKETEHFLTLFSHKYTIHQGKYKEFNIEKERMYEFRAENPTRIAARETENVSMKYLISCNTACVVRKNGIWVWFGSLTTEQQRQAATSIINTSLNKELNVAIHEVHEGKESSEFLKIFGQETASYHIPIIQIPTQFQYPRLFLVSAASGSVKVEEVHNFKQEDLPFEHIAILLSYSSIWVWFTALASHHEKKLSLLIAKEMEKVEGYYKGRPIWVTAVYQEPLEFCSAFPVWYSHKKIPLAFKEKAQVKRQEPIDSILSEYLRETYSIQELLADPLPPGVDPTKLDSYLTEEEFESVFNMRRDAWNKLPSWKRDNLKAEVGFF